jgi:hypothetical protein
MAYFFKINNNDYSPYVNALKVGTQHNYKMETSALGSEKVTYYNTKHIIEVGIIPLDTEVMAALQKDINKFHVSISYRDPETNLLVEGITCIIPQNLVDYYTIRADKTSYNAMTLTFTEIKGRGSK